MTRRSDPRLLRYEALEDRRLLAGLEAQDDFYSINENAVLTTTDAIGTASPADATDDGVLANDSGTNLTVGSDLTLASQNGASVTFSADGTFRYDPSGSNALQSLRDGQSELDTFQYTIRVAAPSQLPVTANLIVLLDASDVTGTGTNPGNGTSLSTWSDLSGNGNDATQGIAILRPGFVTSGIGGKPSVSFNDDFMNFASPLLPADADLSVFVVFDAVPTSGELDGVLGQWRLNRAGSVYLGANQDTAGTSGAEGIFNPFFEDATDQIITSLVDDFPYTEPSIVEVTIDSGVTDGGHVYQNGTLQDAFTLSSIYTGSDTDLGSVGSGLFPFDGLISELLIYDGDLSEEDRNQVGNYLAGKYGVASTYPTETDTATVSVTVEGVSEPEDDSYTTDRIRPLSNTDIDGQSTPDDDSDNGVLANDAPVGMSVVAVNGNSDDVGNPLTLPSGAMLTLNANGSFHYDPTGAPASLINSTDIFTYTVKLPTSVEVTKTVTIEVTDVPVITELMAINDNTLLDYDDDDSDWIEIENRLDRPLDLHGWYVTDDANDLTKWQFPVSTILDPQQRVVVFASNKDTVMPNGQVHTNFRLTGEGEYLALVKSDGVTITSQFNPYPQQFREISFGGGTFMATPTPGLPNQPGAPAVLAAPAYSVDGGLFSTDFLLSLSADAGAEIRYTTHGGLPTESSTLYTGPIPISATTQIRSRAYQTDRIASQIASETYVKLGADLVDFEGSGEGFQSELPVAVIDSFGHSVAERGIASSYFALFDGNVGLTDAHTVDSRASIRVRGTSSANFPKKPFALELRQDHSDDDRAISLLGMPPESDWVLKGPFPFDRTLTRDALMFALSNQIGRTAMRTRIIEVFLNKDGGEVTFDDYLGLYVLEEKIKRDPGRVDVERLSSQYTTQPEITGGYILKLDFPDPGDTGFTTSDGTVWKYVEPKEVEIEQRPAQQAYINGYVQDFLAAVYAPNYVHPETGQHYTEFLDLDAAIDYILLNELALHVEALKNSTYLTKARDGKLAPGPIWDFDRAMESLSDSDDDPRVWYLDFARMTRTPVPPFWITMYADLEFRQAYIDRWTELRRAEFRDANLLATMDALATEFGSDPPGPAEPEAIARDITRWGSRPRTSSEYRSGQLDGTWRGEVNHKMAWIVERAAWMDSLFLQAPRLDLAGGVIAPPQTLTITGPAGATIYYTTDATDPRLPGGDIAPSASQYTGPIVIEGDTVFTTRSYDATHNVPFTEFNQPVADAEAWSGVTSATYVLDPRLPLRIAEVNYNPHDPTAAERAIDAILDNDDFEFIELVNIASHTIPLAGVALVQDDQQGIAFDFDSSSVTELGPGERVVVVEDAAAFQLRYGDDLPVAGQWAGRLNNDQDQLTLVDDGLLIQQFTYDDAWHPTTDGEGFTLEIIDAANPNLESWGEPGSWQPSGQLGGTPGTQGSTEPVVLGDLDRDGDVDRDDIEALVLGLQSSAAYVAEYGVPPTLHGDIDQDGDLDFDDIAGFVNMLPVSASATLGQPPAPEAHSGTTGLAEAATSTLEMAGELDTASQRRRKGVRRVQAAALLRAEDQSDEDDGALDIVFAKADVDEKSWLIDEPGW